MATEQIQAPLVAVSSQDSRAQIGLETALVTVVLPCLNEEASVGLVVREALEVLRRSGQPGEVLVVDNGSLDRSVEVALDAGARVIHERRRGYGRALRSGIAEAHGEIVVMADADWTYDMNKLPDLIGPVLRDEADLVIGSRLHETNRHTMPVLHRYVGTPVLTALVRNAGLDGELLDSQSGFRCFRRDSIQRLNLKSDGMEFASEMLIKSGHSQLRVRNIPTGYRERIGDSKLNTLSDGWRHLRLILLLAPDLMLLGPGLTTFALGAILTGFGFLPSRGIALGSLRWQPVFFATIALVLGMQMTLVGLAYLWRRTSLSGRPLRRRLAFIRSRLFPKACLLAGTVAAAAGLALDAFLFVEWLRGSSTVESALPMASLAQSLLLVGGSLGSFGLIVMWLHWDEAQRRRDD